MRKSSTSFLRFLCFSSYLTLGFFLIISCSDYNDSVVINPPTSDFSFTPDAVNTLQVKFINTSTSIKSFIWSFGDGKVTATVRSPLYTYANPGTYSVTLITVGWNDVEVSTTKEIVVTAPVAVNLLKNKNFINSNYWSTTYVFGSDITTTFNNKLTLTEVPNQGGILVHQAVLLQPGTYQVAANLDVNATQFNCWAEIYFLSAPPVEGEEPEDADKVVGFNSFDNPCSLSAFAGDILTLNNGCKEGEDIVNGRVTVASAGTYYFTIYTGVFDGTYGTNFNINSVGLFKVN